MLLKHVQTILNYVLAKLQKDNGQPSIARGILQRALEINSSSSSSNNMIPTEQIWLALCRLEIHCKNYEKAKS